MAGQENEIHLNHCYTHQHQQYFPTHDHHLMTQSYDSQPTDQLKDDVITMSRGDDIQYDHFPNSYSVIQSSHLYNQETDIRADHIVLEGSNTSQEKRNKKREVKIREISRNRTRQNFSLNQTRILEEVFDDNTHYPDYHQIKSLSKRLKISTERIQVWFQNRRAKFRRNTILFNQS